MTQFYLKPFATKIGTAIAVWVFSISFSNAWGQFNYMPSGQDITFVEVDFISPTHGFASSLNWNTPFESYVLKTSDGGQSWDTCLTLNWVTYIQNIRELDMVNDSIVVGVIADNGHFYKSADSGSTWDTVAFINSTIVDLQFLDENVGFLCTHKPNSGYEHKLYKTLDGGTNWSVVRVGHGSTIRDMATYFQTDSVGYLGYNRHIRKTVDGGVTWDSIQVTNAIGKFYHIEFPSDSIGYALYNVPTSGGMSQDIELYQTVDAGQSWSKIHTFPTNKDPIFDMQFTDTQVGYAVSSFQFFKTDDGGHTWYNQTADTLDFFDQDDLFSVSFLNRDTGWVAGLWKLYSTTNGGQALSIHEASEKSNVRSIYPNPTNDWIQFDFEKTLNARIQILSLDGKIIQEQSIQSVNNHKVSFMDYPSGVYLVRILTDDSNEVIRVVKR